MRVALVALLLLSLAMPAYARGGGKHSSDSGQQANAADQQKKSRAEDKAYKDALRAIPNQKPADPWGKMR